MAGPAPAAPEGELLVPLWAIEASTADCTASRSVVPGAVRMAIWGVLPALRNEFDEAVAFEIAASACSFSKAGAVVRLPGPGCRDHRILLTALLSIGVALSRQWDSNVGDLFRHRLLRLRRPQGMTVRAFACGTHRGKTLIQTCFPDRAL